VFDEVNFHEYPALADLGARDLSRPRLFLQGDRVNLEQRRGGREVERAHGCRLARDNASAIPIVH
jgi:hypothetical protein